MIAQARQALEDGRFPEAKALYRQAQAQTAPEVPEYAAILYGLGRALTQLDEIDVAVEALREARRLQEDALGSEHTDTAATLHYLSEALSEQGDFSESMALAEQAREIRGRLLGTNHPDTLDSVKELALLRLMAGEDAARVEEMLVKARRITEKAHGENNPVTARIYNALGILYKMKKSTQSMARLLFEKALAINEKLKGSDDYYNIVFLNNLAGEYQRAGEVIRAEEIDQRQLKLVAQVYGKRQYRYAMALLTLAEINETRGYIAQARRHFEEALIIAERTRGAENFITRFVLNKFINFLGNHISEPSLQNLSLTLYPIYEALNPPGEDHPAFFKGDPKAAARRLHQFIDKLEAEHNQAPLSAADNAELTQAKALHEAAQTAFETGKYEQADAQLAEALANQERILGMDHLDHVPLLELMKAVKARKGEDSAILPIAQRVVQIHESVLGKNHPQTILASAQLFTQTLSDFGMGATQPVQQEMLQNMQDLLGPDNPMLNAMQGMLDEFNSFAQNAIQKAQPSEARSARVERERNKIPKSRLAVLDGIDAIDWHSLHHAYGPADDVPRLLRQLLSDDEETRGDAWEHLHGNIWHQGTVYEATSFAVPFLLRMLEHDDVPDQSAILSFLTTLQRGSSYLDVHCTPDDPSTWDYLTKQGVDYKAELQKELDDVARVRAEVAKGVPIYLDMYDSSDRFMWESALELLRNIPERAPEIIPTLRAAYDTASGERRIQLLVTLQNLMDNSEESQQFFANQMSEDDPNTSLIAACGLIRRAREQSPPSALTIVRNAISAIGGTVQQFGIALPPDFLYVEYIGEQKTIEFAVETLMALASAGGYHAIVQSFLTIKDPEAALHTGELLLDVQFNNGQPLWKSSGLSFKRSPTGEMRRSVLYFRAKKPEQRPAQSLTPEQRQLLETLLDHAPFWGVDHNLLELYGVPHTRDALRGYLQG